MTEPETYSFERYLEAKRSVDERALNRRVQDRLRAELDAVSDPVRVLEVGAGTGQMVERFVEWAPPAIVEYTAVDVDASLAEVALENVRERAERVGHECVRRDRTLRVESGGGTVQLRYVTADAFEYLRNAGREWDVVVAQAVVDLTDVRAALQLFWSVLRGGGIAYCPVTFDGVTGFLPPLETDVDEAIPKRYHRRMDTTEKMGGHTGDSQAGRHLLTAVPATGGELLAAGGSDWVVIPADGGYPADEAYFLHHIVETVRSALADDPVIDTGELETWSDRRHEQIDDGELVYLTHQLDVLARGPPAGPEGKDQTE